MLGALGPADVGGPVLLGGVVPHHEVALVPPVRVIVDVGVVHGGQVVVQLEEEVAIPVLEGGALVAPRVFEQEVPQAAEELQVVDHDVGVVAPDNAAGLVFARLSCYNLVRFLMLDE